MLPVWRLETRKWRCISTNIYVMVSLSYFKSHFHFLKADFLNLCVNKGSIEEQNWLCMCVCVEWKAFSGEMLCTYLPQIRSPRQPKVRIPPKSNLMNYEFWRGYSEESTADWSRWYFVVVVYVFFYCPLTGQSLHSVEFRSSENLHLSFFHCLL